MASGNLNWYGDIQCFESEPVRPRSESELIQIVRDIGRFPSPIRPMGSRHSVTPCMSARAPSGDRWGTAVDMREFRGPMRVDREAGTVSVPAGLTFFEAAHELRDTHGMQFRVNTELGTLTMGAAACGGTKDSSFPGEFGQVCADVVALKLVTPDGEVRTIKTGDPDFDAVLGGYGLFGIATEITFRAVPHEFISMEHVETPADEFEARSKEWLDGRTAVFLYLFPYAPGGGRIVAELRRKAGGGPTEGTHRLALRNFFWREALPEAAHIADRLPIKPLREHYLEVVQQVVRKFLDHALDLRRVSPVDQIVDFEKGGKKFGFSMWAFPAAQFGRVLSDYLEFCRRQDYRTRLPHVSYHVAQDRHSLLSYSQDSDVWTLDPVSTGVEPGWHEFLSRFNDFCSDRDGVPLFNQTPHLERRHVLRAFGERLERFESVRRRLDPADRMLNEYFANLLHA
jgi:hypothetical protein